MRVNRAVISHSASLVAAFCAAVLVPVSASAADVVRLNPEKVVELARTQSAAVKASELQLKITNKTVQSTIAGLLPNVSANASALHLIDQPSYSTSGGIDMSSLQSDTNLDAGDFSVLGALSGMSALPSAPDNIYNLGLTVTQPLFMGGRSLTALRIARNARSAQKHSLARATDESALAALQLYWTYVGLQKNLETAGETRRWFEQMVSDQQKMLDNGLIIELDLLNTRIALSNVKLAEQRLRDLQATMGGSLLLFLGLRTANLLDADTSLLAAGFPAFAAPTDDTIERRLNDRDDVRALERQFGVVRGNRQIQRAAYLPTVMGMYSFGANNQYASPDDPAKLSQSQSIGLSANWTIFDWGKGLRETQKATYQADLVKLQLDNLREQVRLKIFELAREVLQTRLASEIAAEDLTTARKALGIAQKKYDLQSISNTDLLNARNQLTAKTVAYAQARINAILALEEYKVAPVASAQQPGSGSMSTSMDNGTGTSASSAVGSSGGMSGASAAGGSMGGQGGMGQ